MFDHADLSQSPSFVIIFVLELDTRMADTTLMLSPLELTTMLIRQNGIHRGLWTLKVEFHIQGTNFIVGEGAMPGACIGVKYIGIRQVEAADDLTVDAAAVNPATASTTIK